MPRFQTSVPDAAATSTVLPVPELDIVARRRPRAPVRSRPTLALATVLGLALFAQSGSAFAHAHLQRASPAADSTVAGSPPSLTLRFTEAVEPRFSSVELQDAKGAAVEIAKPVAQDSGMALTTPLPHLAPGPYTVIWHATSVDTHKTEGKFNFTVAP